MLISKRHWHRFPARTITPQKWVVVSDGSTDRTDEIVSKYARKFPFIELVRREGAVRHFGNKVHAFHEGYARLDGVEYDFIGNLDADIELPRDYYERILQRFVDDERLGLAGGTRLDWCNGAFVEVHCARNSVGGPFQLFRRTCYESFGGYIPLKLGGIDAVAEIMCRQRGWRVRSFTDVVARHYRCTGTAKGNIYEAAFRGGKKLYVIGYHPLFEVVKLLRVRGFSGLLENLCEMAGYSVAAIGRYEKQVPADFVAYLRREQADRLKHIFLHRSDPAMATESAG